jgi:hypothetical protein
VVIEGWFRRGLRPYTEMSGLTTNDGKNEPCLVALGAVSAGRGSDSCRLLWRTAIG